MEDRAFPLQRPSRHVEAATKDRHILEAVTGPAAAVRGHRLGEPTRNRGETARGGRAAGVVLHRVHGRIGRPPASSEVSIVGEGVELPVRDCEHRAGAGAVVRVRRSHPISELQSAFRGNPAGDPEGCAQQTHSYCCYLQLSLTSRISLWIVLKNTRLIVLLEAVEAYILPLQASETMGLRSSRSGPTIDSPR